jgi:nicotinamide-nucleotide amidase
MMNASRLGCAVSLAAAAARAAQDTEPPPAMDYCVVVTGGELLEGAYPDGHTHYLTRTLRPLGLRCLSSMIADDRRADLFEALRFATNRAGLVLVTSGLGPTPNDITRETLGEFTGIPLKESEEALVAMERGSGSRVCNCGRTCASSASCRNQGVPQECQRQRQGSCSRCACHRDRPPQDRRANCSPWCATLVPWLRERFGIHALGDSITLRFVGSGSRKSCRHSRSTFGCRKTSS